MNPAARMISKAVHQPAELQRSMKRRPNQEREKPPGIGNQTYRAGDDREEDDLVDADRVAKQLRGDEQTGAEHHGGQHGEHGVQARSAVREP